MGLREAILHAGATRHLREQVDAIPAAEAWLEHYGELLRKSTMSAAGPLASAFADVRGYERSVSDVWTVLSHPRFFRVERIHYGHRGECPQPPESCDGVYPCWRFDVGVALVEGRCEWESGTTVQEALAKMAARIRAESES